MLEGAADDKARSARAQQGKALSVVGLAFSLPSIVYSEGFLRHVDITFVLLEASVLVAPAGDCSPQCRV